MESLVCRSSTMGDNNNIRRCDSYFFFTSQENRGVNMCTHGDTFYDSHHMNRKGATLFTQIIASEIKQTYKK